MKYFIEFPPILFGEFRACSELEVGRFCTMCSILVFPVRESYAVSGTNGGFYVNGKRHWKIPSHYHAVIQPVMAVIQPVMVVIQPVMAVIQPVMAVIQPAMAVIPSNCFRQIVSTPCERKLF